jgi:cyanophycinase
MSAILLAGGAEFGGRMREPDLCAIELAGGLDVPVRIIPTAAAPDNNHKRAGNNGVRWFKSLGARDVDVTFVIDRASAQDKSLASHLRSVKLIYLLGGFPRYLCETLSDSIAWQALMDAYHAGGVIAGSSAGAMVLCEHYYDPFKSKLMPGLNLIPNACVLPHHNSSGKNWAAQLSERLPQAILIGIDEQTGMINNAGHASTTAATGLASAQREWKVYGAGAVTLYHVEQSRPPGERSQQLARRISAYVAGESFSL